jgi:acetylglutamate kinase
MTIEKPTFVIKFGGNAMTSPDLFESFARDIAAMRDSGSYVVICHGGGPQISRMLSELDIPSEFHNGLRVTTPEVLRVVATVLNGEVQREVVTALNREGIKAIGLFGDDSRTYTARAIPDSSSLGLVGEIAQVDTGLIKLLLENGYVPVVSPVASDVNGVTYNVNADAAAGSLAGALGAVELIMMTDVAGVYRNWPDLDSIISHLSRDQLIEILPSMTEGMIPKLQACLHAIDAGAQSARIINGSIQHSLASQVLQFSAGTVISR